MKNINFLHIPKNGGSTIEKYMKKKINKNYTFIFNHHHRPNHLENSFIILRNPMERFTSAVFYAIDYWGHGPQIKFLIDNGYNTPEKWIQLWKNPSHPHHKYLLDEILNKSKLHKVGSKILEYKFTYSPQAEWINNPTYIIFLENYKEEMEYFLKHTRFEIDLNSKTNTKKQNIKFQYSKESLDFLKEFYKEDFILYEYYKKKSLKERLPF